MALLTIVQAPPTFAQSATKEPVTLANPCTDADFWLGEWEVREPDTIKIANVSVIARPGHCAIAEVWTWTVPTDHSRGDSYCLMGYSEDAHNWQYDCATNYGSRYSFDQGIAFNGGIRFNDRDSRKGTVGRFSFTPMPDGRVHEFEEESSDGGKTWQTTVHVFWNKRK